MQAKIYVSSTYQDLIKFREAVSNAIRSLGHVDIAMEYYGAESNRPIVRCINDVQRCDIYLGVFGLRYGFVPKDSGLSITEQEFRAAIRYNKEILCFLLRENADWPDSFKDTGEHADQIQKLRKYISDNYLVDFFLTPDELATKVTVALAKALEIGTTPTDNERENRLIKEWREGKTVADRMRARKSLFNMGSTRYAAAIKDLLIEEKDADKIASYMEELLSLSVNSRQAMSILTDLLANPSGDIRFFAVFNIGELGLRGKDIKPEIIRELMKLEDDPEDGVRGQLAHTLGKINHDNTILPAVKSCLEKLSSDGSVYVCEKAKESQALLQ